MRNRKGLALLILVLALTLSSCAFGGAKKIGKSAALEIAMKNTELSTDWIVDVDVELERDARSVWYKVSFESGRTEYEYKIDAYSGAILFTKTE